MRNKSDDYELKTNSIVTFDSKKANHQNNATGSAVQLEGGATMRLVVWPPQAAQLKGRQNGTKLTF